MTAMVAPQAGFLAQNRLAPEGFRNVWNPMKSTESPTMALERHPYDIEYMSAWNCGLFLHLPCFSSEA